MAARSTKARRALFGSAARTATVTSTRQKDRYSTGARFYLIVSAASGTGGLKVIVRGYDAYGNAFAITAGGTAVTATGSYVYELNPGDQTTGGATSVQESAARPLPMEWDVQVTHGDSSSYTYALTAEVFT